MHDLFLSFKQCGKSSFEEARFKALIKLHKKLSDVIALHNDFIRIHTKTDNNLLLHSLRQH